MEKLLRNEILAVAMLVLLAALAWAVQVGADTTPEDAVVTSVFEVEGMTCGGCEVGLRMKVKKLDGVEKVEASHKEGTAVVTYDAAKVTPEDIVAAIEDLGYTAKLLETKEPAS
jgi:copper chaperone CopZ